MPPHVTQWEEIRRHIAGGWQLKGDEDFFVESREVDRHAYDDPSMYTADFHLSEVLSVPLDANTFDALAGQLDAIAKKVTALAKVIRDDGEVFRKALIAPTAAMQGVRP